MFNSSNILKEKTSNEDFQYNKIDFKKINVDMNKTVVANSNKKSNIKSRKVIKYLEHNYAVKYNRKICPIITVTNKFKESDIDSLNKLKNITNELNLNYISFNECLKNCSKERNDKYYIDEFINLEKVKNNTIYIDSDMNTENMLDEYNITKEFLRNVGPCIDLLCGGFSLNKNKIFRIFNSGFN